MKRGRRALVPHARALQMHKFKEQREFQSDDVGNGILAEWNEVTGTVQFHTSRAEERSTMFPSCLHALSIEPLENQMMGFYLSLILSVLPDLENVAADVIREHGWALDKIATNQIRENNGMTLMPPFELDVITVYFGLLVFIMFKQINRANYTDFMAKRTDALMEFAGVTEKTKLSIALSLDTALVIKIKVGSHSRFKRALLMEILAVSRRTSMWSSLCTYICEILAWTEMSSIMFIYEELVLTRSPVLKLDMLYPEVKRLAEAFKVINKQVYPQFFKILEPPRVTRVASKSHFPTLIQLAKSLIAEKNKSVPQYRVQQGIDQTLVHQIITLHKAYSARTRDYGTEVVQSGF